MAITKGSLIFDKATIVPFHITLKLKAFGWIMFVRKLTIGIDW